MDMNFMLKNRSSPLVIQGIKTNPQGMCKTKNILKDNIMRLIYLYFDKF